MTICGIPHQINPALKGIVAISFLKHGNCIVMLQAVWRKPFDLTILRDTSILDKKVSTKTAKNIE
jgi:hypothetical protein